MKQNKDGLRWSNQGKANDFRLRLYVKANKGNIRNCVALKSYFKDNLILTK